MQIRLHIKHVIFENHTNKAFKHYTHLMQTITQSRRQQYTTSFVSQVMRKQIHAQISQQVMHTISQIRIT